MDFPSDSPQPQRDPGPIEPARPRPTEFQRVNLDAVERQCRDLRTLLNAAFVAVLLLSVAVNLFLAKQMRLVRGKVSESRPIIQRMQAEFQRKEPNMRNFVSALQSFASFNPDFQPILIRYRQVVPQYFNTQIAVTAPSQTPPGTAASPVFGQPPPKTPPPAGGK